MSLADALLPVAAALLGWWFSTGVILYLNHRPRHTHACSLFMMTLLAGFCLLQVPERSAETTRAAAYAAFCQALVIWGWLEMSYLMGFVTGPRSQPCPAGVRGWRRFRFGVQTSLYHELAVVAAVLLVFALSGGGPNRVAAWTLTALWLMRWSTKLNLFLGVRNYNVEWLPARLRYLDSYIRQRPMNPLFPVSVALGTAAAALLVGVAVDSPENHARHGAMLVASMVTLGVLEHGFLVLPLRESALWQWALPAGARNAVAARFPVQKQDKAPNSVDRSERRV